MSRVIPTGPAGSSPRPWGTQRLTDWREATSRFIPTPVGNTEGFRASIASASVHPHARGEHSAGNCFVELHVGSSPRPWGTLEIINTGIQTPRFIPTPVGNTRIAATRHRYRPVHPHARGEHSSQTLSTGAAIGSSPRPWGTLPLLDMFCAYLRFIPTPVGNTNACFWAGECLMVHPHARGEHRE